MTQFTKMEKHLVQMLRETREATDNKIIMVQTNLQKFKRDIKEEIMVQVNQKYKQLDGSVADAHAKHTTESDNVQHQVQDLNNMHDKAQAMVSLTHEARNKYTEAMVTNEKLTEQINKAINQNSSQIQK